MAGPTNMPDLRARLTLDISDFTRGLTEARAAANLFNREIESVGGHFKSAGVAMATFATISLFTAGLIATSFTAAIGVLMSLGVVSAFQAESVQNAWSKTGEHLRKGMLDAAESYVPVLERLAGEMITGFDRVQPAFTQMFARLAPVFEDWSMSFMGWFEGLINRLPTMVNNALAFMDLIAPAWDEATDNMRAGWNRVYQAVLDFGPRLLIDGLPPFGAFVGAVLTLLEPIIESSSQFAGPFFSMLTVLTDGFQRLLGDTLREITPELIIITGVMQTLGLSVLQMFSGVPLVFDQALHTLESFGNIAAGAIGQLGPTFTGLLLAAEQTATELLPVMSAVGAFLVEFGPLGVAIAQMITGVVRGFVTGIQPLLDAMGLNWADDLTSAVISITPMMEQLALVTGQFVTAFVTGVGLIINGASALVSGITFLNDAFSTLGYDAGRALVVGIIAGLGFMVSPLVGVTAGLVAAVASFLPRSPAEQGPLSGDGAPDQRGYRLGEMFAAGIVASSGLVATAAGQLAGAVGLTPSPNMIGTSSMPMMPITPSAGGDVTNVTVTVEGSVTSERDLIQVIQDALLKKEARNSGSVIATLLRGGNG